MILWQAVPHVFDAFAFHGRSWYKLFDDSLLSFSKAKLNLKHLDVPGKITRIPSICPRDFIGTLTHFNHQRHPVCKLLDIPVLQIKIAICPFCKTPYANKKKTQISFDNSLGVSDKLE